jgi:hypothetical protein
VDPLAPEIDTPKPDIEKEAPTEHDLASTAEDSPAVSTSDPETSYTIEVIQAAVDPSLLAESAIHDDENAVNQTETVALQSELEPSGTEAEYTVEEKTDEFDGKTSSAPILAAAEQLPEVPSQEIIQPQPTAVLITEDDQDNKENQVEIVTTSSKLEGHGTTENIEAKDYDVKEVCLTCSS